MINAEDEITYNPTLVKGIFLETGLQKNNIRTKLKPLLQSTSVDDAELMETMKRIVLSKQEHRQKLVEISKSHPVKVQAVGEKSGSKQEHTKKNKTEQKGDELLAALKAVQEYVAQLSTLKKDAADLKQVWGKSSAQGNTQGPDRQYSCVRPRVCQACQAERKGDTCDHCYQCGGSYHFARDLFSIETRANHLRETERGYHRVARGESVP